MFNFDNNSSVFYTRDIYGTTRYVTDSNGFSESYNYDSFGKPIFKDDYVTYEEG